MDKLAIRNDMSIQEMGKVFYVSKLFRDTESEAQAMVKIMAGQEMGLKPFEAMAGLNIIKGKVTASAHVIAGRIKASGRYNYRIVELTEEKCHLEFWERSEFTNGKWQKTGDSVFTMKDAEKAGLLKEKTGHDGSNYNLYGKYNRNLLFSRAISNGEAWFCPNLFSIRLYTEGEIPQKSDFDINEEDNIVDAGDIPQSSTDSPILDESDYDQTELAPEPTEQEQLIAQGDRLLSNLPETHTMKASWEGKKGALSVEDLKKTIAWMTDQIARPTVELQKAEPLTNEQIQTYIQAIQQEYGEQSDEIQAFGGFIEKKEWMQATRLGEGAIALLTGDGKED